MRIKLSANSIEATNYITNLGNNNCHYSYYYANNDKLNEDSWALKIFSTIEKIFFKNQNLPESQKVVVQHIDNITNEINKTLDKNNIKDKDIEISLNVDSNFNKWLKHRKGILKFIIPAIRKVRSGLLETGATYDPKVKRINISLEFYGNDNDNLKSYPFISKLLEKMSLEETIRLSIYHELSHSLQYTNIENKQISWEYGISDFLTKGRELIKTSPWYPHKKLGEQFEEKTITGSDKNLSILNFIDECITLDKEIYADVSSLLLLRNENINKGAYTQQNMHEYIDALIEARCEENHKFNYFNDFVNNLTNFNHNTVCGLEYLKEIIDTLPNENLSPERINSISDKASKVGLSRILLVSRVIKSKYFEEFKLLFNIEFNEDEKTFFLPQNINSEKADLLWNNIKNTAGEDWYQSFISRAKKASSMMTLHELKTIWYAGANPISYKNDIAFHNNMVNQFKAENVTVKIEDVKITLQNLYDEKCKEFHNDSNKNFATNSIQKLRNKFINYATKTPKLNSN